MNGLLLKGVRLVVNQDMNLRKRQALQGGRLFLLVLNSSVICWGIIWESIFNGNTVPIFIEFFFNLCFQLWDVLPRRTGEFTAIIPDILDMASKGITD